MFPAEFIVFAKIYDNLYLFHKISFAKYGFKVKDSIKKIITLPLFQEVLSTGHQVCLQLPLLLHLPVYF